MCQYTGIMCTTWPTSIDIQKLILVYNPQLPVLILNTSLYNQSNQYGIRKVVKLVYGTYSLSNCVILCAHSFKKLKGVSLKFLQATLLCYWSLVCKMHWHRPFRKKVVSSQNQKIGKDISPVLSDRVTYETCQLLLCTPFGLKAVDILLLLISRWKLYVFKQKMIHYSLTSFLYYFTNNELLSSKKDD